MKALIRIARTEILEHIRQPWMLFILAINYVLWLCIFGFLFLGLDSLSQNPQVSALLSEQLRSAGMNLEGLIKTATSAFGSLIFTNLPLYVAIMSGTSVIHDRERGTMPFLMLAPLSRQQLLGGKLLGAMVIPFLMHLLIAGGGSLLIGSLDIVGPYAWKFGYSRAWWIAFVFGSAASAALGTVISALSRDMRTSMQYTSFFIGLLSLAFGYVLVDGIARGTGTQIVYALLCFAATALTLNIGAGLISRDITV